jgi:hypothetical protein
MIIENQLAIEPRSAKIRSIGFAADEIEKGRFEPIDIGFEVALEKASRTYLILEFQPV